MLPDRTHYATDSLDHRYWWRKSWRINTDWGRKTCWSLWKNFKRHGILCLPLCYTACLTNSQLTTSKLSGWYHVSDFTWIKLRKKVTYFAICTPTLRLVLDRGCAVSVNLQPSVFGVSTLAWGSGISRDAPPDDGKIPKERGRSLLER